MRVTDPTTPSHKQVQYIQDRINKKMGKNFPNLKLRMKALRINMTVASGKDVTPELIIFDLERILGQDMLQNISPPEPDIEGECKGECESPKTTAQ